MEDQSVSSEVHHLFSVGHSSRGIEHIAFNLLETNTRDSKRLPVKICNLERDNSLILPDGSARL